MAAWKTRAWAAALLLSWAASAAAAPAAPEGFWSAYEELAALVDGTQSGPVAVGRGTYLASWFYAVGEPGLPACRTWFRDAPTPGRAGTAALFLALHGSTRDHERVRQGLESDRDKHRWLYGVVGNDRNLTRSLRHHDVWTPLLRSMPGRDGPRRLSGLLLASPDPLVRRGGLFLGFWFASGEYWDDVRRRAKTDPSASVRAAAAKLLGFVAAPPPRS